MRKSRSRPEARVRPVRRGDLAALIALCGEHARYERAVFEPAGLAERLRVALFARVRRLRAWVAQDTDGTLLGYAAASAEFSTWSGREHVHLDCLFVRPAARGQGTGAALLRAVRDFAAAGGFQELQWQTPAWNARAIRFYRRCGARDRAKRRFTLRLAP